MSKEIKNVDKGAALRKHAEKRLGERPRKPEKKSKVDTASLLHELQVHQIELEMQNEELRKAQVIIENSNKRFSDLYDFSPVGYFTVEPEGRIKEANLTGSELLGLERTYLIGKPLPVFVHPEDKDKFYRHLISLRKGVWETCEIRLVKRNAVFFYAQLVSTPLTFDAGPPEEFLIAVFDISARKRAEESVEATRAHLSAIVENSYDAIISKTLGGIVESWNLSAQKMYGFSEEEIKGKSVSVLAPPDRADEMTGILKKIAAGETVKDFETVRRKKDGTDFPVSLTVSPVKTTGNEIIGASTIIRDITEKDLWEGSILELNERLLVSNRELEGLGHSLSHDLRGPIISVEGFVGILLERHSEKLDNEAKEFLKIIGDSVHRMSGMISGLLNIAQIARAELRRDTIDLSALARSIIQECKDKEPARIVEISIHDGLCAKGDAKLTRIALENLIRNAWKFTRKCPQARIEFGQTDNKGEKVFFVRDNGAGFDMENSEKMFMVFKRLHTESEFEGSGVGLATVQRIIKRHGGKIWAEGKAGAGAVFYFTLS
jgi:PAS domain S-box-containing protein